jgi:hypothetical protein
MDSERLMRFVVVVAKNLSAIAVGDLPAGISVSRSCDLQPR